MPGFWAWRWAEVDPSSEGSFCTCWRATRSPRNRRRWLEELSSWAQDARGFLGEEERIWFWWWVDGEAGDMAGGLGDLE